MTLALDRVHAGDCLDLLADLDEGSVGFAFCDLPYGLTANRWDVPIDLTRFWPLLRRACSARAAMVFTCVQPFTAELLLSNRSEFRFEMIWKKNVATGFYNARKRPLRIHENILVFWREHPVYYPQKTAGHKRAKVTPSKRAQRRGSTTYGDAIKTKPYDSTERYPTTVLELAGVEQHDPARWHATQKPEGLPGYFIRTFTDPGVLVLDPSAGSGSTLLAAKGLDRRSVGFELNPEFAERANATIRARYGPDPYEGWDELVADDDPRPRGTSIVDPLS